ncbi:YceI family protein [Ekhidna sp.]|uniref:YceI family protein n=1 Tax=Ekhidna sp. TaxID=2608089 RepID=UPI003CCBEBAA
MIKAFIIFAALLSSDAKEMKVNTAESVITWTGKKVVGKSHNGTLKLKEGALQMDGNKLTGGSFVIDMNSLNNEDLSGEWKAKLEGHLKSDDFFSVETYPTAEFVITEAKSTGKNSYDITGDVTIKGKTETISFPATIKENGGNYEATADLSFDRSKFDVKYGSDSFFDDLGDKVIEDNIDLSVKLIVGK